MSDLTTYHAPPERKGKNEVTEEHHYVKDYGYLKDIFDAMPEVAVVLNDKRQIVYANEGLLSILPSKDYNEIIGSRPGEAIDCINSKLTDGGCGTSEACRFCGAVNAILQSGKLDRKVSLECRIVSFIEEEEVSFDYKVTASPAIIRDKKFTMMFMQDISAEKRKMALERIFFHDILNTAGGIKGFTGFLQQVDEPETIKEYVKVVEQLSHDLIDEIQAQRSLVLAENDDLIVNYDSLEAMQVLKDVKSTVSYHVIAEGKDILISSTRGKCDFLCDGILIKRVLINMLKNALEASEEQGQVLTGFYNEGSALTFYVHNDQYMNNEVQLQVFKRSFSTKGKDRGLGTYSIKLLAEKYLKGKVWFETNQEKGTTFFVQVPVKQG
ncbi:MAG: PAS domain-containing sensor histidine kinase [Marinilabiliaceae bacterium]|jgi:signal transduction histidine kinase|nr:PAS domain-containing sensor histidine kinase [Marinilabiliaceae bacterium]